MNIFPGRVWNQRPTVRNRKASRSATEVFKYSVYIIMEIQTKNYLRQMGNLQPDLFYEIDSVNTPLDTQGKSVSSLNLSWSFRYLFFTYPSSPTAPAAGYRAGAWVRGRGRGGGRDREQDFPRSLPLKIVNLLATTINKSMYFPKAP